MRVCKGLISIFLYFFKFLFNAPVSACRILLQSSKSLPIGSFSYSATTAHPPSVESALLINLFLFLRLRETQKALQLPF